MPKTETSGYQLHSPGASWKSLKPDVQSPKGKGKQGVVIHLPRVQKSRKDASSTAVRLVNPARSLAMTKASVVGTEDIQAKASEYSQMKGKLVACKKWMREIDQLIKDHGLKANAEDAAMIFTDDHSDAQQILASILQNVDSIRTHVNNQIGVIKDAAPSTQKVKDTSRLGLASTIASDFIGRCAEIASSGEKGMALSPEALAGLRSLLQDLEKRMPLLDTIVSGGLDNPGRARTNSEYHELISGMSSELDKLWTPIRDAIERSRLKPDPDLCLERGNEVLRSLYEIFARQGALSFLLPNDKRPAVTDFQDRLERFIAQKEELLAQRDSLSISAQHKSSLETMGITTTEKMLAAETKLAETQAAMRQDLTNLRAALAHLKTRITQVSHQVKRLFAYHKNGGFAPNETMDSWVFHTDEMTPKLLAFHEADVKATAELQESKRALVAKALGDVAEAVEEQAEKAVSDSPVDAEDEFDAFFTAFNGTMDEPASVAHNVGLPSESTTQLLCNLSDAKRRLDRIGPAIDQALEGKHKLQSKHGEGFAQEAQKAAFYQVVERLVNMKQRLEGTGEAKKAKGEVIPFAESSVVASVRSLAESAANLKQRVESKCASAKINAADNKDQFEKELEELKDELAKTKETFDGLSNSVQRRLARLARSYKRSEIKPVSDAAVQKLIATQRALGMHASAAELQVQRSGFKAGDEKPATGGTYAREDYWTMQKRRSKAHADLDATWKNLAAVISSTESLLHPKSGLLSYIW